MLRIGPKTASFALAGSLVGAGAKAPGREQRCGRCLQQLSEKTTALRSHWLLGCIPVKRSCRLLHAAASSTAGYSTRMQQREIVPRLALDSVHLPKRCPNEMQVQMYFGLGGAPLIGQLAH